MELHIFYLAFPLNVPHICVLLSIYMKILLYIYLYMIYIHTRIDEYPFFGLPMNDTAGLKSSGLIGCEQQKITSTAVCREAE